MSKSTPLTPRVFEACSAHEVLRFSMEYPASSTNLIICSDRNVFLQDLLRELQPPIQQNDQDNIVQAKLELLRPTLHNLQASRNINLSFCPDLAALQAHLSVLLLEPQPETSMVTPEDSHQARPLLMIMNLIRVHEPTSSYSIQGFNRTFASAVETAHHLAKQLVMVECVSPGIAGEDNDEAREMHEEHTSDSPWDQRLSMLNVTTKTFGAGERGWVGRTVKIRQVAERWCKFVRLEDGTSGMKD